MRKFYSILAVSAAAALALVSCSKELAPADDSVSGIERTVTFHAGEIATKTAFGDLDGTKYPTLWTANDAKVKIFQNLKGAVDATVAPAADFKTAELTASITSDDSGNYTFYARSHASQTNNNDRSTQSRFYFVVPDVQTPLANSPQETAQILYAKSSTTTEFPVSVDLEFRHLTAYGKLSLTNLALAGDETVQSITISSDNYLAKGNFYYVADIDTYKAGDYAPWIDASGATKIIKLVTSSLTDNWFACVPSDLSGTELSIVVNTNKDIYKKTVTVPSGKKLLAGQVVPITVDMAGVTKAPDVDAIFTAAGYDLAKYNKIDLTYYDNQFYNSLSGQKSGSSTYYNKLNTGSGATLNAYVATQTFSQTNIPSRSVIVVRDGFKYRPDAWTMPTVGTRSGFRPLEVSSVDNQIVVVDDAWWMRSGNSHFLTGRGFNIALAGGGTMSASEMELAHEALGIYVPIENDTRTTDEIFTEAGYNLSDYDKVELTFTRNKYYNSSSYGASTMVTATDNKWVSTQVFDKADLPNGTVVVLKSGYQYRPDAWQNKTKKNNAGQWRPNIKYDNVKVVDNNWWMLNKPTGSANVNYVACGFILSTLGGTVLNTEEDWQAVENSFAIYVPKK